MGNVNMEAYQVHYRGDESVADHLRQLDLDVEKAAVLPDLPTAEGKTVLTAITDDQGDTELTYETPEVESEDIAPAFSEETEYSEGDLVYYDGILYKFAADHTAGSWDPSEVTQTTVAAEFNQLKNTLIDDITEYPYAPSITIEDAVPSNLADCTVKIEPIQDLHGYDHPWAGGAGKNLYGGTVGTIFDLPKTIPANTQIAISFTRTASDQGNDVTLNLYKSGESTRYDYYTISGTSRVVTATEDTARVLVYGTDINITNIQIEIGTSATSFAPYSNICPISGHTEASVQVTDGDETTKTYTIALGDTIYGGTLDVKRGVLTITHVIADMGDLTWTYNNTNFVATDITGGVAKTGKTCICSCYKTVNNVHYSTDTIDDNSICMSTVTAERLYVHDSTYSDASAFKTARTGQKICYELATPTTIQLTPQKIQLLKGRNTLTASTGDISVTVNGVSGAIGQVQEQVNATDAALAELAEQLPTAPTADGAYVLTVTVAVGTPTYSWESAS